MKNPFTDTRSNRHTEARFWSVCILVSILGCWSVSAFAESASGPLTQPFPRILNYGWLTDDQTLEAMETKLLEYSGVIVDAAKADGIADEYKTFFGNTRLLLGAVEWKGKDPSRLEEDATGPSLSSIFSGHFQYFEGALMNMPLYGGAADTEIHVDRITRFEPGDIAIIAMIRLSNGKPFFESGTMEYLLIESVRSDAVGSGGYLDVQRGYLGSTPKTYTVNATRVHTIVRGSDRDVLRWNLALNGPSNSAGLRGYEAAADWVSKWLTDRHPEWDGIVLPGARWRIDPLAFGNTGSFSRAPDTNVDSTGDWGFSEGVNQIGSGQLAMTNRIRTSIGTGKSMLVGFQPGEESTAGPWPVSGGSNGLWFERFPEGGAGGDVDSGFARIASWNATMASGVTPVHVIYTQKNTVAYGGSGTDGNAAFRVGLATACLMDGWHVYTTALDTEPGTSTVYVWDEYRAGRKNFPGWLGYPLEPTLRHTEELGGSMSPREGWQLSDWTTVIRNQDTATSAPVADNDAVRLDMIGTALPYPEMTDIALQSPEIGAFPQGSYTIQFSARSEAFSGEPEPPGREIRVALAGGGQTYSAGVVTVGSQWEDYILTVSLPLLLSDTRLSFDCGGLRGSIWIRPQDIFTGSADRFSRRFQGGVVLLNAAEEPFTFPLTGTCQRIDGTIDPVVNNGATGLTEATVPPNDALFLLVSQSQPTPTPIPTPTPTPSPTQVITPSPSPTLPPIITFTPTPTPTPPPPGDVISALLNLGDFTPEERGRMDQNGDDVVDVADLVWLLSR